MKYQEAYDMLVGLQDVRDNSKAEIKYNYCLMCIPDFNFNKNYHWHRTNDNDKYLKMYYLNGQLKEKSDIRLSEIVSNDWLVATWYVAEDNNVKFYYTPGTRLGCQEW